MSVQRLLNDLRARDAHLSLEGDRLKCTAPKGGITPELQRRIAERKLEIVRFLRDAARAELPPIQKTGREGPLPLSFAQERMWLLHRLQPENAAYNITAFKRFTAPIVGPALERSVCEVVRRHESLRTSFTERQGAPAQLIHQDVRVTLPVTDLTAWPEAAREDRLQVLIREQTRQPFDLAVAPLFRVGLVRLTPEEHVFVLTIHHSIADGRSLGIFLEEVGARYREIVSGAPPAAADLPLQYADYACWQRKELSDSALEEDLSYWKQKLAGCSHVLELPLDHQRPPVQGLEGAVVRFDFPPSASSALKSLAHEEGASLFMTLLAAFQALLYRYTGQADILVGSPVDTRNRPELEGLIGCFLNTLALRTTLPGGTTARDLLRQVRQTVLEAHAHRDLPFERLVATLQPERTLSHSALFQVAFTLQNTYLSSEYQTTSVSSMFDLSLFAWETAEGISGAFEYSAELFEASTIARMARHLGVLAAAMAASPDQPLATLPLLDEAERTQLLETWNRTSMEYPRDRTIHELFGAQARVTPHSPAVVAHAAGHGHGERQITYSELDRRSNRLAHRLRALGVGPDVLAGICLERSIDMVVALLGVLKAGGAYVPMDPQFPRERLAFMAEDARMSVLVTEDRLRGLVAAPGAAVLSVDGDRDEIEREDDRTPVNIASPESLAYVIYTSGSTGRPKGVRIAHRSVVNLLESMRREPGLGPGDRLVSVTTLSFDIAGLEIYLPLIVGARLVLASSADTADGLALSRLLAKSEATVMQATPATWRLLLEAGWKGQKGLKILCGGEALGRDMAGRLLASGSEVYNLYGPTETTIWSTVHRVTPGADAVPIGRPIANTQVYLLDENRQPVPPGVPGELYIGGDGLARGYLNRPELTAKNFVPHPFRLGERVYRTGDLARWLPDGVLQFLGRRDHQIKIRGFRIELEEIENVLRGRPDVQDAVVAVAEDGSGGKMLVCYVASRTGARGGATGAELRRYLAERVPEYMVPATFMLLDVLPLTANGKVDRQSLPAPQRAPEEPVAPRNPLETQLLSIWQEVLDVHRIGIRDNFFDLGGHSLLAVMLFAKLERVLGPLPVSLLFQAPTVEQMAAKLADAGLAPAMRSLVAMQPGGSMPPLFLVPGASGNVLTCTKLAHAFGPDQPVYGLHSAGLIGRQPAQERIEDIAARFLSEIQSFQKSGPYHLAGICIGGAVAYEMAQQLTAQGHQVATLAMIESWPPSTLKQGGLRSIPIIRPALFLASRIGETLGALWRLTPAEKISAVRRKIGILARMATRGGTPESYRSEMTHRIVEQANYTASSHYRPKPYGGRILLIIADARPGVGKVDPRLQWVALSGGKCDIHRFDSPSSGHLLNDPWVQRLAGLLQKTIGENASRAGVAAS